jgi:hypothetical protein
MANVIIQDFQAVMNTFNSVSPMGVVTIVAIGYVILPRLKFLQKFLLSMGLFKGQEGVNPFDEIKPILQRMVDTMELIKGNDLIHLKQDIESLGSKIDTVNERFLTHDNQAKAILSRTNDVWEIVKEIKK